MLAYYILLSIFTLFLFLFHKHASKFSAANLPPGWIGWPVIGDSLAFLTAGRDGRPEKYFFERAANFSVFKTSLLGEATAVMCGAAANKFLFSNEEKLVKVWFPSNVVKLFPYSAQTTESATEEAKKVRRLISHFVRPESLRRHVSLMDDVARKHFAAEWHGRREVKVLPLAKRFAFAVAARLFVSLEEPQEVNKLHKPFTAVAAGIFSVPVDFPGTTLNKAVRAVATVREEIAKVIKVRKAEMAEGLVSPGSDILTEMMVMCDEKGRYMSELDIADKTLAVLVGSHDTISSVCTLIVMFLAELPNVYQAVYQEQMSITNSKPNGELLEWEDLQKMKYSWNVAQEALRIAPPAQGGFREAITNFTYNNFSIPKGWKLYWSASATHKNPSYFPQPEKFDPTRFEGRGPAPHTFVPFGGGPRMCPGREYARVKVLVFMHNLVKFCRWEKLVPDEKIMVYLSMPIPVKGLPIRLFPHAHTS